MPLPETPLIPIDEFLETQQKVNQALPPAREAFQQYVSGPMESALSYGLFPLSYAVGGLGLGAQKGWDLLTGSHTPTNDLGQAAMTRSKEVAHAITPQGLPEALTDVAGMMLPAAIPGSTVSRKLARVGIQTAAGALGGGAEGSGAGRGAVMGGVGGVAGEGIGKLSEIGAKLLPGSAKRVYRKQAGEVAQWAGENVPPWAPWLAGQGESGAEQLRSLVRSGVGDILIKDSYEKSLQEISQIVRSKGPLQFTVTGLDPVLPKTTRKGMHPALPPLGANRPLPWDEVMDAYSDLGKAAFNDRTRFLGSTPSRAAQDLQNNWVQATHDIEKYLSSIDPKALQIWQGSKLSYLRGQAVLKMLKEITADQPGRMGPKGVEFDVPALQSFLSRREAPMAGRLDKGQYDPLSQKYGPAFAELAKIATRGAGVGKGDSAIRFSGSTGMAPGAHIWSRIGEGISYPRFAGTDPYQLSPYHQGLMNLLTQGGVNLMGQQFDTSMMGQ